MGKAGLLQPAADNGVLAGNEINDFGFDLLRRLDSTGNLCASPASIALALAMVRPGARGITATEMDKVLHDFGSDGQAGEVVALLHALQSQTAYDDSDSLPTDPGATPDQTGEQPVVELDVSNAVFSQQGMSLEQPYLDSLSSGFGAGVGLLDFMNYPEAARQIINGWASDRTKGRIPEILQPGDITNQTRIALANAIYLKAGWTYPFDPNSTKSLSFTRPDGSLVSVPTMAIDRQFAYSAGTGYRAVELPLGGDYGDLSMTIVVPDDMASFVSGLTATELTGIDGAARIYDVDLTLPRFSVDSRADLATVLQAMGMTALFDPGSADLSGITTDERLAINKVIHEANIDVVEQGTTASAVTVVTGRATAGGGPPPRVQLHVDRPFLYFIREGTTGAVLFMGRVDDPSASS
ncbi:MAG TPA: serpin family protein [Candidatus Limnocylindrales bacterium]|jgi:serpin B